MDRPISLHVRSSPTDPQFLGLRMQLIASLAQPKVDGLKCYDASDLDAFKHLLEHAENSTSLTSLPVSSGQLVIAEFSGGKMKVFENVARYLETYQVPMICTNPNCKKDHSTPPPTITSPKLTVEDIEKYRDSHDDACKKIVESYVSHVNALIVVSGLAGMYNSTLDITPGTEVPPELRNAILNYVRLIYNKTAIIPLRNREDTARVLSMMAILDEAEMDDTRTLVSQMTAPAPQILTLSRSQRKSRDREYMLHCIAILASLKFDQDYDADGPRGRSSMYV